MKLSKLLASTTIIIVSSALGVEGKTSLRSAGKNGDAEKHSLDLKHFDQEERSLREGPPNVDTTKEDGMVIPGGSRTFDLNLINYSTCNVQKRVAGYGQSEQLYESKMAMDCPTGQRPIMWNSLNERECKKDKIQCFWTEDPVWTSNYLQCYIQVAGTNKCDDDDNTLPFGVEFTCCEFD